MFANEFCLLLGTCFFRCPLSKNRHQDSQEPGQGDFPQLGREPALCDPQKALGLSRHRTWGRCAQEDW